MNKLFVLLLIMSFADFTFFAQTYDLTLKIDAADGAVDDRFGNSVSISGNFLIAGAHYDDDDGVESGAAYIWEYDGTNWIFFEKLTGGVNGAANDKYGNAVSISGNHAVVGAWADGNNGSYSGSAYIYHYNGTTWGAPTLISGEAGYDTFGASVCVNGNYMIIGAIYKNGYIGAAYIYHYEIDTWILQDIVSPSNGVSMDEFGCSVSITDTYAIIGSHFHNTNGAAYIYQRNGTDWNSNETIIAPTGTKVGHSVSISGNKAVIGTQGGNAAFVYEYNGTDWIQTKQFTGSSSQFGEAVSISGNNVLIGDWGESSMTGSAIIYTHDGGTSWSSQALTTSGIEADDRYGNSVCISDNLAIVGAHYDDPNGAQSGSAIIYTAPPPPAPAVTQHPQNTSVCTGSAANFNIVATDAVSYQWYNSSGILSDGGDISGSTSNQLSIANTEQADEGIYYCIVSNGSGNTQSNNATLTVDIYVYASAGNNDFSCNGTYTLNAETPSSGTGLWSVVSGCGNFDNNNSPTATVSGLCNANNILRWEVTNGACTTNNDVTINYEQIIADFYVTPGTLIWPNATFTIENQSTVSANTYDWNFGDGNTQQNTSFVGSFDYTYSSFGEYVIALNVTGNYCNKNTQKTVTINEAGYTENLNNKIFNIFPNPAKGMFIIQNKQSSQIKSVSVFDITGKSILKIKNNSSNFAIDLSEENSGIYILSIQTENNTYKQIIIKE